MSACPRGLGNGSWRHDKVLRMVADTVEAAIRANNYKPEARPIYFDQAGEPPPTSVCKINSTIYRSRLAMESRHWESFESSRADCNNNTATGFNSLVN